MGKRWSIYDVNRVLDRRRLSGEAPAAMPVAKEGKFFTGWNQQKCRVFIGIDTGAKTGIAIWNASAAKFDHITTTTITRAMEMVRQYKTAGHDVTVRVEDARLRKWFGDRSEQKAQGAGSVKRDASIWEDFLKEHDIRHEMVHPMRGGTKLSKEQFFKTTGYTGLTSEHSRDAAMLVYKF